jgi:hypothetical protein
MVCNVSNIMLRYGYASKECDVYRFWEKPSPIHISTAPTSATAPKTTMVLPLVIRCPANDAEHSSKSVLLAIFGSFGPAAMVTFRFNASLQMDISARAFDAETGKEIEYQFRLDRHDFRMLVLKTDDELQTWSAWHVTDIHV